MQFEPKFRFLRFCFIIINRTHDRSTGCDCAPWVLGSKINRTTSVLQMSYDADGLAIM